MVCLVEESSDEAVEGRMRVDTTHQRLLEYPPILDEPDGVVTEDLQEDLHGSSRRKKTRTLLSFFTHLRSL